MDPNTVTLLAQLPGLQLAKRVIEQQIAEIERRVYGQTTASTQTPVLGPIDFGFGTPKKKRNISPELREQKRKLIADARAKKLQKYRELQELAAKAQGPPQAIVVEAPPGPEAKQQRQEPVQAEKEKTHHAPRRARK